MRPVASSDTTVHAASAAALQVVRQLQAAGDLTGMQVDMCSTGCLKHPHVCLNQHSSMSCMSGSSRGDVVAF